MIHRKTAARLVKAFRSGSSLPVLIETDEGELFVIKWHNTGEGAIECISDWIWLNLASCLAVPVPAAEIILIPTELAEQAVDGELKELMVKSAGLNLGIRYFDSARPWRAEDWPQTLVSTRERIFLFDLLILNIDRTERNPNMLMNHHELLCIDFSASVQVRMAASGRSISEDSCLVWLRQHPFYSQTMSYTTFQDAAASAAEMIPSVIAALPDGWLSEFGDPEQTRAGLRRHLNDLLTDPTAVIHRRLEKLVNIPYESVEMLRRRVKQNSRQFQEKYGLNRMRSEPRKQSGE